MATWAAGSGSSLTFVPPGVNLDRAMRRGYFGVVVRGLHGHNALTLRLRGRLVSGVQSSEWG